MLIKAGVDISRLNKYARKALLAIAIVYGEIEEEIVITSTYEGNHMPSSLHYHNDAFDIRLPGKADSVKTRDTIKFRLGKDFDVVLKPDHIHIEYDPKD